MTLVEEFNNWYNKRKPAFDLEDKIRKEKLAAGINGIEWLVMQTAVNERNKESLNQWLEFLVAYKHTDTESVMRDVLIMEPDPFYEKYEFNWWISIRETFTYLNLLKERNYDRYFQFIQSIKEKEPIPEQEE